MFIVLYFNFFHIRIANIYTYEFLLIELICNFHTLLHRFFNEKVLKNLLKDAQNLNIEKDRLQGIPKSLEKNNNYIRIIRSKNT